jgi:UPF0716 protein FxsA
MPFIIFFILISLPVLEVASIVQVSRWVGPVATFLLLAAGVAFGAYLIRSQSLIVGRRVMDAMRRGAPPEKPMLDSGMVSLAGILFMIPGFITDIIAILLLLPAARRLMWRALAFGLRSETRVWRWQSGPEPAREKPRRVEDVIDADFTEAPRDQDQTPDRARRDDSPWRQP